MQQLDDARLSELAEVFGPEDLSMVVEAFLEEAEQAVAGLAELISDAPDRVRDHQLHYLVGAARNLGASGLADLCKAHEGSGAGFGHADFDALVAAFRATREAFAARLSRTISSAA